MKYRSFLIKYGEIGCKGKNRFLFEDALAKQLRTALEGVDGDFVVSKERGRIYADAQSDFDYDDAVAAIKTVFGIVSFSPMVRIEEKTPEALSKAVVDFIDMAYEDKNFSFKVFTRRADKTFPGTSETISCDLGGLILDTFPETHVDVHTPDVKLRVEIRNFINIYSEDIPGPGGMPVGTNGKAMLLLSGGIDSPVAGYMIAKRGVKVEAVYFHAPPYTSERAKQKVIDLATLVAKYAGPINLHIVNFTDIQMLIYEKCPHEELTIIMRRYMMRIAQIIARNNENLALITGESIGQVASQTVQSLVTTDAVCEMPVFRPLIGFDKQEIIDISEKIGTFETSIEPYEDCCTIFVAKHPVTKPILEKIEKSEAKIAEEAEKMVATAVATKERILCKSH